MLRLLLVLVAFLAPQARAEVVVHVLDFASITGDGIAHVDLPPYTGTGTLISVDYALGATVAITSAAENLAPFATWAGDAAVFRPMGSLALFDGSTTRATSSNWSLVETLAGPFAPFDGALDWFGPSAQRIDHTLVLNRALGSTTQPLASFVAGPVQLTLISDASTTIDAWGNVALWQAVEVRGRVRVTYTAR